MSSKPPSDRTIAFYEENAEEFFQRTVELDVEGLYRPFLELLPPGGRILDLGCGPGRDLKAFSERGYSAMGIDASASMVRLARDYAGQDVQQMRIEDADWEEEFDGIWACASLLHVSVGDLVDVLRRLGSALKPNGVMYVSFKHGLGEVLRGERMFTDMTELRLRALVEKAGLHVFSLWKTEDVRPQRATERWLNALIVKQSEVA